MTGHATGPVLPTVTGFAAKQVLRRGVTTAQLLHRAGLSEHDIEADGGSPVDYRVSAEAQAKLLEYAAEALADSALGFHLAEQSDPPDAGILFNVASGAGKLRRSACALFALLPSRH
jgi:hypothetical protein